MKLDEIKLCEDGYYYDQFEKTIYDVSGSILIPLRYISLDLHRKLLNLLEEHGIKLFPNKL